MIYGVCYYPEHWDAAEWKEHARLMRDGNFNAARLAEFAWGRMEPSENCFSFSWLDEAIEVLAAQGIGVILGTPTAAPPKWLVNQYDVFMRDHYGRPRGYGSRRACCANNPFYIAKSRAVVEKMAEHYQNNPNVIAWQVDNEFGCHGSTLCYCEHCRAAFAVWLKDKYGEIDTLNRSYGTVFWSQEYGSFSDVILPAYTSCEPENARQWAHNPSLDLDFRRFSSESWVKYQQLQIDILKSHTGLPITHNMMGHFSDIDYYKLGKGLDVVSWDNYISNQWSTSEHESVSMAHELMRGVKNKSFWVMEQQSGACGWDLLGPTPRPGQLRLWTYQAIAHGCEGVVYFRFKAARFGMEQYWYGILDQDGVPGRRYAELQKTGAEIKRLSPLFLGARSETDVLIVKSYEHTWSHNIKRHVKNFDYRELLYSYYKANHHLGTNPACGPEEMIRNEYKVVYIPAFVIVTPETQKRLEHYVENGGCLVMTYRSGIRDENNNICSQTLPGLLTGLAGATVEEFDTTPVDVGISEGLGASSIWRDILKPTTAEPVAVYQGEYYKGKAAITKNSFGKGHVWYIGCDLTHEALLKLVKLISDMAGAKYSAKPPDTEVIKRKAQGVEYTMLMNYSGEEKDMGLTGKSLLSQKEFNGVLPPYGVEILAV